MRRTVPAALLSFGLVVVPLSSPVTARQAPAAASDPQPVRVGGAIQPPTKIKDARPVYPAEARASRTSGVVFIEAMIGVDGKVTNARIFRSATPTLDEAALDAVKQWEYTPTVVDGRPVPVLMTVTVNFSLDGPTSNAGAGAAPGSGRRGGGAPPTAPYDLTGVWRGDDGGTYQIRTTGIEITWMGRSDSGSWANVFHGAWAPLGHYYSGRFVDVPPAAFLNDGVIAVRPVSQNLIEMVGSPTNFTGRRWQRVGPPVDSGPPPPGPARGIGVPGAGRLGAAPPPSDELIPAGQFGAGAYRAGSAIEGPWISKQTQPEYTKAAMDAKIQGTVLLDAVVREDGTVGDVRVNRSLDTRFGLDDAAIAALKQWQFTPAQDRSGRRVPALVTIEISFRVR